MKDPLTRTQRSARMALVRARGNASTEMAVAAALRAHHITGWRRHRKRLPGTPDFVFQRERVAMFVDGCFWHGCPTCRRRLPLTRRGFWREKIANNKARDRRVNQALRQRGYRTFRVWEHAVARPQWLIRLGSLLATRRRAMIQAIK